MKSVMLPINNTLSLSLSLSTLLAVITHAVLTIHCSIAGI